MRTQPAEDTIIAALLAGFWAGFVMDKLTALTLRWNMPALHKVAQWWPLLLIAAGTALLVRHRRSPKQVPVTARVLAMPSRQKEQAHA